MNATPDLCTKPRTTPLPLPLVCARLGYLVRALVARTELNDHIVRLAERCCPASAVRRIALKACRAAKAAEDDRGTQALAWLEKGMLGPGEAMNQLARGWPASALLRRELVHTLQPRYRSLVRKVRKAPYAGVPRLAEVKSMFGLSEAEEALLVLCYLRATDSDADVLYDQVAEAMGSRYFLSANRLNPRVAAVLTGLPEKELAQALTEEAALLRCGLLDRDRTLNAATAAFLAGQGQDAGGRYHYAEYTGPTLPISQFAVTAEETRTVMTLIRNRPADRAVHILLYGEPGTGKTSYARALGAALGYKVCEVYYLRENTYAVYYRCAALDACCRTADLARTLVVMDEADAMLNVDETKSSSVWTSEKGLVNRALDNAKGGIVWIVNRIDGMDESTRRRFDFAIRFERSPVAARKTVWTTAAARYQVDSVLSPGDLDHLAERYEVTPGAIEMALRNLAASAADHERGPAAAFVGRLLSSHLALAGRSSSPSAEALSVDGRYSLEGLNVSGDLDQALRVVDSFNAQWSSTVAQAAGPRNVALLLYGPPGTGKTEFARYLARRLQRPLECVRASDVLDRYVGGTEKRIQERFESAARQQAVLFLDEIDGLMASRQSAHYSWEVTQVNELLSALDSYRGVVIAATNNREWLDSAALRRFSVKLAFDFLRPEGALHFYRTQLAPLCGQPLTSAHERDVREITRLTPGDFRNVYQVHSLMERSQVTHESLIAALRREAQSKAAGGGRKMGLV